MYTGNGWSRGDECSTCALNPAPSRTHNGTWHDATYHVPDQPLTVSFSFQGTSITIYCILPNPSNQAIVSQSDLLFSINGTQVGGGFSHSSDRSDSFQFDTPVFSVSNLTNTTHSFTISTTDKTNSVILFDYATYSYDDGANTTTSASPQTDHDNSPTPAPSKRNNHLGLVLGLVLGGIAIVGTACCIAIYLHHRRSKRGVMLPTVQPPSRISRWLRNENEPSVYPFMASVTTRPAYGQVRQPERAQEKGRQRDHSVDRKTRPGHSKQASGSSSRSHTRTPGSSLSKPEIAQLRQEVAELRALTGSINTQ